MMSRLLECGDHTQESLAMDTINKVHKRDEGEGFGDMQRYSTYFNLFISECTF